MSLLRPLFLVLLALLLPVRGLMAATMPCAEGLPSAGVVALAGADHPMVDPPMSHTGHDDAAHAASPAPCHDDAPDDEPGASANGCHACASGCCMASIVGTPAWWPEPAPIPSVAFPALSARVPAFHSGGLDRPPRTA